MLAAKAEHRKPAPVEGETPKPAGKVVDLMAALNASVEAAKAGRGETTEDAVVHDLPKNRASKNAAKKSSAKTTTARKATAKKPAAKKTAGRNKPRSA